MTKADLLALADRVEKLTWPDRETDAAICLATGWRVQNDVWAEPGERFSSCYRPPHYTASLDAAMTLVPEDHGWIAGSGRTRPDEPLGGAQIHSLDGKELVAEAEAATPALALTAACLRARASTDKGEA